MTMTLILAVLLLAIDEEDERDGLEDQHHGETDTEGDGEELGLLCMREEVGREDHQVDEQRGDGGGQEELHETLGRLVHALHHKIVLHAGDGGEIERQQRHDREEPLGNRPHHHKGGQCQHQRHGDERNVISLHLYYYLFTELHGFLGGELLAIVAAQLEVLLVDDVEFGGNHLGIGDALGVGAAHKVLDMVGHLGVEFLHHLVVLDVDNGGKRSHEGNLADLFDGEVFVLDFDNTFLAQFATAEEVADKYFVFVFLETQDANDLVDALGGAVVDNGAGLDGANDHFFLVFHSLL